jgi:VWFA-related protein
MRKLLLLFFCSAALAQQQNVNKEVRFVAADKKGQIISIPAASQISATVNDRYPSAPFAVHSATDLPLRIGLVVDTSNSVQNSGVNSVVGGATRLLSARLHTGDAAFVISVKSEVDLEQDWTNDGALLAGAVQKLRAGGGTALFDGIYFGCKKLAKETSAFRKAMIVTSDGDDNQSHATLAEAEKICFDNGIAVNTINYKGSSDYLGRGARVLEALAKTTGGLCLTPDNDKSIRAALEQLSAYWDAEYRGIATFPSLPEEKKIKNAFVTIPVADHLQKYKAGVFSQAGQ